MATITLEIEEYKELLETKIRSEVELEFREAITAHQNVIEDLKEQLAKAEENKIYWYNRWSEVQKQCDTYCGEVVAHRERIAELEEQLTGKESQNEC